MANFVWLGFLLGVPGRIYDSLWAIPGYGRSSDNTPSYCDIKLRAYHHCDVTKYEEYCVEDGLKLFSSSLYYDKNKSNTVFVSLPFYSHVTHYNVLPFTEALTSRCEFNIIVLDNSIHTDAPIATDYPLTVLQVYGDSQRYAKVFNEAIDQRLLSGKCLTGLGFSLGGQQVGQICRQLSEKCCHILAVDPAGPLYKPQEFPLISKVPHLRLTSRSDACHVVFVTCNRWIMGTGFRSAHDNIIVNGGIVQPPCSKLNALCSHEFCKDIVIDAIRRPHHCLALEHACGKSELHRTPLFHLTLPFNGSCKACSDDTSRTLYLTSSSETPSCIGEEGAVVGEGMLESAQRSFIRWMDC